MDFSDYTLVSFGDSFTFGHSVVPKDSRLMASHQGIPSQQRIDLEKNWKLSCNNLSYTQVIADNMGFKNSLNFGVPGGSNDRSLMLLESFLRSNPTLKIFVLFNFTSSSRFMQYFHAMDTKKYENLDIHVHPESLIMKAIEENRYPGVNKRSLDAQYSIWRSGIQEVYYHIRDRRSLYNMLSSNNIPHATFDVINDVDYRILRDNPMSYIDINDGIGMDFMWNDDESYVFKPLNFFESYYQELIDKSPLLTHMTSVDLEIDSFEPLIRNLDSWIGVVGGTENWKNGKRINKYSIESDGHWNAEGHIEVAKLIENYINKNHN